MQGNVERPVPRSNVPHPSGTMTGREQPQGPQAQPREPQRPIVPEPRNPRGNAPVSQGQFNPRGPAAEEVRRPPVRAKSEPNRAQPQQQQQQKPERGKETDRH